MSPGPARDIVEEIRTAYRRVGITLDRPATYGTYYRLLCAGCGAMLGNVGDRLLPDMAAALVEQQFELYGGTPPDIILKAQREITRGLDAARWEAAQRRHGGQA